MGFPHQTTKSESLLAEEQISPPRIVLGSFGDFFFSRLPKAPLGGRTERGLKDGSPEPAVLFLGGLLLPSGKMVASFLVSLHLKKHQNRALQEVRLLEKVIVWEAHFGGKLRKSSWFVAGLNSIAVRYPQLAGLF